MQRHDRRSPLRRAAPRVATLALGTTIAAVISGAPADAHAGNDDPN